MVSTRAPKITIFGVLKLQLGMSEQRKSKLFSKEAVHFLLKIGGLYLLYYLVYELWILPQGYADNLLIRHLINVTETVLQTLNYETFSSAFVVGIEGSYGIKIGPPCNGISLFALFAGLIIAYPSSIKSKLIFIPPGLLVIHALNIVRLVALAMIAYHKPESLGFHHSYTFAIGIYVVVFAMWYYWMNRKH